MKKIFYSIFITCLFLLSSCSIQKRLYTKGFYSDKAKTLKKPEALANTDTLPRIAGIHSLKSKRKSEALVAATTKFILPHSNLINGCDTLVLKNGTKITCTVTNTKNKKIYFKNCNSTEYFCSSMNQSDVNRINFANGIIQSSNFNIGNSSEKTNGLAIAGFIASILALLFLILVFSGLSEGALAVSAIFAFCFLAIGFTLSVTSIIQIMRNKTVHKKGLFLGIIGIILSLAFVVALLVLVQ